MVNSAQVSEANSFPVTSCGILVAYLTYHVQAMNKGSQSCKPQPYSRFHLFFEENEFLLFEENELMNKRKEADEWNAQREQDLHMIQEMQECITKLQCEKNSTLNESANLEEELAQIRVCRLSTSDAT